MIKLLIPFVLSFTLVACNPLSIFSTPKAKVPEEPKIVKVDKVVKGPSPKEPKTQVPKKPKVLKSTPKVLKKRAAPSKPVADAAKPVRATEAQIIKDCKADFVKTQCIQHMPDRKGVEQCMYAHKAQLAPICKRHLK